MNWLYRNLKNIISSSSYTAILYHVYLIRPTRCFRECCRYATNLYFWLISMSMQCLIWLLATLTRLHEVRGSSCCFPIFNKFPPLNLSFKVVNELLYMKMFACYVDSKTSKAKTVSSWLNSRVGLGYQLWSGFPRLSWAVSVQTFPGFAFWVYTVQ